MPKDGSLSGNTKGTACPAYRILGFILPSMAQRLQKEILFAEFFETTEMSLTTHSCHKEWEGRHRLLSITRMTCEDIVVVNRNRVLEM